MIKIMKLSTCEELIGEIVDHLDGAYKVKKPRVFTMMETHQGPSGALVPFLTLAPDEVVTVSKSSIVAQVEATKEVADKYLQATTNIQLATTV